MSFIIIQSKDGKVFTVSAIVLATKSPFIRKCLKYNYPNEDSCINLPISSSVLEMIVQWTQGESLKLDLDNIFEISLAVDYLMMQGLVTQIDSWAATAMEKDFSLAPEFWACWNTIDSISRIKSISWEFMLKNLNKMKPAHFKDWHYEDLLQLLNSDHLKINEEELWFFVKKLVKSNDKANLYSTVRLGLLSKEFLDKEVFSTRSLTRYLLDRYQTDKISTGLVNALRSQDCPRNPREFAFILGGWRDKNAEDEEDQGGPETFISVFDPSTSSWTDHEVQLPLKWAYLGAVLVGSSIYMCGGYVVKNEDGHGEVINELMKLDLCSGEVLSLSKMRQKRNYLCLIGSPSEDSLYAIGGNFQMGRLDTVEKYSIETNQWSTVEPMKKKRSDAGVALLKNDVYVVGGFDGIHVHRSVEMYNSKTGKWKFIPPMKQKRSGVKATVLDNKLYVVGGWDGQYRMRSGEVYNPAKKQWEDLPEMIVPRSNYSMTVVDGQLLVAGGYDGGNVTSRAEILNKWTNVWEEVGALPSARSASAIITAPVDALRPDTIEKLRSRWKFGKWRNHEILVNNDDDIDQVMDPSVIIDDDL